MSKKKNNKPVQSYILAIKSMSLASGMMVLGAACDSIKKEWSEWEKVEDAYTKQLYDNRIKNFNPSKIACKILMGKNKEDKPVIEWNFNSLKLAIDTMFALNETTERKTVKMCKHCGKPFSSENLRAEYCIPQCRNQANVYKSRGKIISRNVIHTDDGISVKIPNKEIFDN